MKNHVVTSLDLPLPKVASGKVREIFELGKNLLFVASDRVSAYDVVLPTGIPNKGKVLTQLSRFWFDFFGTDFRNHMITCDPAALPPSLEPFARALEGRFMVVRRLTMFPVECVVRGYLVGSGYKEYTQTGTVCGLPLPPHMSLADRLGSPIFTPARKAVDGHDENISFEAMVQMLGAATAEALRRLSLDLYQRAADHARARGIIIADTKFEFGMLDGKIVLADEVLTPDSSRFWPQCSYRTGSNPPSFDKQFVRDYLSGLDWDKTAPGPGLPDAIVEGTSDRYLECYKKIVGQPLIPDRHPA